MQTPIENSAVENAKKAKENMLRQPISLLKKKILTTVWDYFINNLLQRNIFSLAFSKAAERDQNLDDIMGFVNLPDAEFIQQCKTYCEQNFRQDSNSTFKTALMTSLIQAETELNHKRSLIYTILRWQEIKGIVTRNGVAQLSPLGERALNELRYPINWGPYIPHQELLDTLKDFRHVKETDLGEEVTRTASVTILRLATGSGALVHDTDKFLAISLVIAMNNVELLQEILDKTPAAKSMTSPRYGSLAHVAFMFSPAIFFALQQSNTLELSAVDEFGKTVLHYICASSLADDKVMKCLRAVLIQAPSTLRVRDIQGNTPLHMACFPDELQSIATVRKTTYLGPHVNRDNAILNIARKQQLEIISELLEGNKSAPIDIENTNGRTPLSVAADHKVMKLLRKAGARINSHVFIQRINSEEQFDEETYLWLLKNGLDLREDPFQGYILLLKAIPHEGLTRALLEAGVALEPNDQLRQFIELARNRNPDELSNKLGLVRNGTAAGWQTGVIEYFIKHFTDKDKDILKLLLQAGGKVNFRVTNAELQGRPKIHAVLQNHQSCEARSKPAAVSSVTTQQPQQQAVSVTSFTVHCSPDDIATIIFPLQTYANKPLSGFWHHNNAAAIELITKIRSMSDLVSVAKTLKRAFASLGDGERSESSGYYRALREACDITEQMMLANSAPRLV